MGNLFLCIYITRGHFIFAIFLSAGVCLTVQNIPFAFSPIASSTVDGEALKGKVVGVYFRSSTSICILYFEPLSCSS